jgi:uncharacterized glyoxalase superfamily protein PhnB
VRIAPLPTPDELAQFDAVVPGLAERIVRMAEENGIDRRGNNRAIRWVTRFPAAVPEVPAANVDKAAAYYVDSLGFTLDSGDDKGGIAGTSRGNCRLFITNRSFRESFGNAVPILFWLNVDSKAAVDELLAEWKAGDANIVSEPEDKPWKLREFMAADLDGNMIRVFYDFRRNQA